MQFHHRHIIFSFSQMMFSAKLAMIIIIERRMTYSPPLALRDQQHYYYWIAALDYHASSLLRIWSFHHLRTTTHTRYFCSTGWLRLVSLSLFIVWLYDASRYDILFSGHFRARLLSPASRLSYYFAIYHIYCRVSISLLHINSKDTIGLLWNIFIEMPPQTPTILLYHYFRSLN